MLTATKVRRNRYQVKPSSNGYGHSISLEKTLEDPFNTLGTIQGALCTIQSMTAQLQTFVVFCQNDKASLFLRINLACVIAGI